jgi:hypothetical protein
MTDSEFLNFNYFGALIRDPQIHANADCLKMKDFILHIQVDLSRSEPFPLVSGMDSGQVLMGYENRSRRSALAAGIEPMQSDAYWTGHRFRL